MTFTLHWWFIPIALLLIAAILFVWSGIDAARPGQWYGGGLAQAAAGFVMIFVAIAFACGHWL